MSKIAVENWLRRLERHICPKRTMCGPQATVKDECECGHTKVQHFPRPIGCLALVKKYGRIENCDCIEFKQQDTSGKPCILLDHCTTRRKK